MASKQLIKMLLAKTNRIATHLTECELYAGLFREKELMQTFAELSKANADMRKHLKAGVLPPALDEGV